MALILVGNNKRGARHIGLTPLHEPVGNRTQNPRLKRPLLCQLSYGPNAPKYSIAGMKWANWKLETGYWKLEDRDSDHLPPLLVASF